MKAKKAYLLPLLIIFSVLFLGCLSVSAASWKTIATEKTTIGKYSFWKESDGGGSQDFYVQNNKTGSLKIIAIQYTGNAVTNGTYIYYSEMKGKAASVDFHKYKVSTGKDTLLAENVKGYNLVAYKGGYIYYNKPTGSTTALYKFRVSTGKSKRVKKNFWAESWNGGSKIFGHKRNPYSPKLITVRI